MKKILIIDDNREIRENICEILRFANYNTIEANNGIDGIRIAKKELPDLILCDIMMPKADGHAVLREISKDICTEAIPFIFLTSKADINDKYVGLNLGADDYLLKPFDEEILLITIQNKIQKSENTKKRLEIEQLSFINALEKIQFMTSHNVRGSLCSFLGLINMMDKNDDSLVQNLRKIMSYAESSAIDMDKFTRELTDFAHKALTEYKSKIKNK
jgi:CheY-like chemotaxis protein